MTGSFLLPPSHVLHRIQRRALAVGILASLLCVVGAVVNPAEFLRSYLVAYLFWFGIALGSMAILMIHHITGGAWGAVIRRLLESGTRTLPLMALLFLPLVFGLGQLYEWARPEAVARDATLLHKHVYLNVPFFLARAALYFAAWCIVARLLNRWSVEQDRTTDPAVGQRLETLSRGGLVLVGLTMTFASVDWIMSLEPHWFSTIYGILIMGGQVLAAMAFVIPLAALLAERGPLSGVISPHQFHDLGNLLLAFVMLWAYFAFSQFLIIWSANLPEEIPWYLHRAHGGWQVVGIGIILFHFILPFILLLSRTVKRSAHALALVALGVIAVRFVDLFWLVMPAFHPSISIHWMDVVTPIGVGGIWLSVYIWHLQQLPLVAANDPSLPQHA